jgi:hypothetical protein
MNKIIAYKNAGSSGMFCQLKFDSNERILISIAQTGVRICKLSFGGLIPTRTLWESNDSVRMVELFGDENEPDKHLLDAIITKLMRCNSVSEVLGVLGTPDQK